MLRCFGGDLNPVSELHLIIIDKRENIADRIPVLTAIYSNDILLLFYQDLSRLSPFIDYHLTHFQDRVLRYFLSIDAPPSGLLTNLGYP